VLASFSDLIRTEWEDGDADAIVELHRRVYVPEYGMNETFLASVGTGVARAVACGWPRASGAVWLVERSGRLMGSLALTDEDDGSGRVRWFALDRALRGRGLGRRLVDELLATARAAGLERLQLETYSALGAAARIYRDAGFSVVWERRREDWGTAVVYQGYELQLR
jgi:ribosomal protein S18 acetylase RimI-like enzyme